MGLIEIVIGFSLLCFIVYIAVSGPTELLIRLKVKPKEIQFTGIDLEMLNAINSHREGLGLVKLKSVENLTVMAENHVIWMSANEVSHYGYTDRQLEANASSFGEVICPKRNSAYSYLMSYLNSRLGHKEVIEKQDVTSIGIFTNEKGLQCILVAGY